MELGTPDNFPVFCRDSWTGHDMNHATQHQTGNDLCRWSDGTDTGRDDYVGVENNQAHSDSSSGDLRMRLISASISSSLARLAPDSSARRHPSRKLASAIARRSSRSSLTTSPKTGTKKNAGPFWPTRRVVSPAGTSFRALTPRVLNSRSET
jgi:hypothetical protein